ncbi:uncharacterized protein ACLA_090030 [Aspergillus clavatus NRRL 1]|uniref:Uncharacterized protein n=1 Tax=Aspergillus clavatus (strain ATCC 1007 / CBS 513.65 / DSM 816 / NCTC 3887 / NRRL 1 / QM 1276 / 107) TaxID=344612 RepID=A1CEL1_ASPCL|nr:uncharacterized protein ACLA_090030 [Aspergillus clavatus NRRL 1]EAW11310.1 hypothetical protein ACLA_090030 [Aspergillus clavatus NRRL 1]
MPTPNGSSDSEVPPTRRPQAAAWSAGRKSQVASRKSQVASRKSQVASRKSQVTSRKSQRSRNGR